MSTCYQAPNQTLGMKNCGIYTCFFLPLMLVFSSVTCSEKPALKNPPDYDLNKPIKYFVPNGLLEISGIALYKGRPDSIYAHQDENGRIYYMKPGNKRPGYSRFAGGGDYEDIAIMGEQVFILRSDGVLFAFLFKNIRSSIIPNVNKLEGLLPPGEYEGIYADEKSKRLYVLCKTCKGDNVKNISKGYIFEVGNNSKLSLAGEFSINVKDIETQLGKSKLSFRPSALAKNVSTNEWYILSSVNKALIVTDAAWKVKAAFPLRAALFVQPEGIAFDNQNNLYISNEGDELNQGTILKFNYKK